MLTPGLTFQLPFEFRETTLGELTSVDLPVVNVYTPQKTLYVTSAALTPSSTAGKYEYPFFVPAGLTVGNWFGLGVGITNNYTLFSEPVTFEIVDFINEPMFVGVQELREFMELDDTDHSEDNKLRQILRAAIELVEGYTQRHYGLKQYHEVIEINATDRAKLRYYPVNKIISLDAGLKVTTNAMESGTQIVTGMSASFFYRLDERTGIIWLTDPTGYSECYDCVILVVDYLAGYATIPEPVRTAVLMLAKALNALSCISGTEVVRLADISYQPVKDLFKGPIGDMLSPYRNMMQV